MTVDYVDQDEQTKRFSIGVSAIVRITLRDGVFHEDLGYGHATNIKAKGEGLDKVCSGHIRVLYASLPDMHQVQERSSDRWAETCFQKLWKLDGQLLVRECIYEGGDEDQSPPCRLSCSMRYFRGRD